MKSFKSIKNYMSAIRLMHKYSNKPCPALDCFELQLTLRAIKLNLRHVPKRKLPITPKLLRKLVSACDYLPRDKGKIMKVAILFGYFGMLRQSNLAPRNPCKFDPTRHTCRQDILEQENGLAILVKWTKAAQTMDNVNMVSIPSVKHAHVDPVRAYRDMVKEIPSKQDNCPLLISKRGKPIHIGKLRKLFNKLLEACSLSPRHYSLHSLRRGAATTAHNSAVAGLDIARHGGWASNAYQDYIMTECVSESKVAKVLAATM